MKFVRYISYALILVVVSAVGIQFARKHQKEVSLGASAIGGEFTLKDQYGKRRYSREFNNKLMLVYFGYSFCPDICPTSLSSLSQALNMLGKKSKKIQPIFVTVDPARDTVDSLKTYMESFHSSFLALTGTQREVSAVVDLFKVYVEKVIDPKATDYLLDHSSLIYILKKGVHVGQFSHATPAKEMVEKIKEFL